MRKMLAMAAAMAILAGCGDSGGADKDGDGEITAEEMAAEAAEGGDVEMRPGKWEQKIQFTEVDMPGMPEGMRDMIQGQMSKGMTVEHCVTPEEARKPDADMFKGEGQENCTFEEFDRSGSKMTMKMTCDVDDGGKMTSAMSGEFGAESFTLNIDTNMSGGPQGAMSMKGTISGRYVGECS